MSDELIWFVTGFGLATAIHWIVLVIPWIRWSNLRPPELPEIYLPPQDSEDAEADKVLGQLNHQRPRKRNRTMWD